MDCLSPQIDYEQIIIIYLQGTYNLDIMCNS